MPSPGPLELIIILAIIVIFVVPIALIVAFARRDPSVVLTAPARDPALDALRIRLASGEIDEAEYDRLRATLQTS